MFQGTKTMVGQLQPIILSKVSAKQLLLDDSDYSTPQDHYFSYINRRQTESLGVRKMSDDSVMQKFDLVRMMPRDRADLILSLEKPMPEPT